MRLLEDRFVIDESGSAIDLATGAPVIVQIADAGTAAGQLQWTLRCDRWRALQHRAFARLVDYGLTGACDRFEAWQCGGPWAGAREEARAVRGCALQFLRAAGMRAGSDLASAIHSGPHRPVVVPDAGTGYPNGSDGPVARPLSIDDLGLLVIPRPALAALGEMAEQGDRSRSRIAVLWGPAGSGKRIAWLELARIARTHGFVPIAARLLDAPYASLWQGRSLFILAGGGAAEAWSAALQSTLRSPRPHVVLVVSESEQRGVDGVRLAPLEPAALETAVFPRVHDEALGRRVRQAALRARGLPGRFVRLLWHRFDYEVTASVDPRAERGLRVAESSVSYGSADTIERPPVDDISKLWPATGELTNLRHRVEAAQALIDRGRHAPGIRQLRLAIGGLARRDQWEDACRGSLRVAACLLRRGRPRDAHAALDDARRYAAQGRCDAALVDVATLTGEAWIDLARLDEAETVLATAATSARGLQDAARVASAVLALARCLYWRGQYAEAASALSEIEDRHTSGHALRWRLLAARIAIGRNQFERATELAAQGVTAARTASDSSGLAAALHCAALIRLAIGDVDAVQRDLADALAAARAARDPLRATRVRLLRVEVERRLHRHPVARAQLERVGRLIPTLPPLLRARVDLMRASLEAGDLGEAREQVSRLVAATGLGALTLYGGSCRAGGSASETVEALAGEVIAIVRACQTAADEAVVLKDVCERVRQQIHAVAVAFVAGATDRFATLVSVGPRLGTAAAERAVAAGITIAPQRLDDRVESAVPIRYGGTVIGALCARWTLGSTHDIRRAAATLEMAAAAAAPIVSAFVSRRDVVPPAPDLIGVTAPMAELRRTVERAAIAPFSVLVEGESGSGKELVARAIHRHGPRRDRTFCTLNCAALPDDLVEAELFGHARGAFTGAVAERAGVFEEAHGGTLFLDEIGELSPRAQAKVLRVIQEGELRRVGENLPRRVDVRIVAATNRDLRQEVEAGRFRSDLWYRLDVIRVSVPPLRERREDIPVLAEHFWREAIGRLGGRATLGAATLAALARYDWPGNVRELQNVLAALAVRSPRRGVVPPTALPPQFGPRDDDEAWRFDEARQAFEERFVRAALVRSGGHRGRAASELGVSRQGLTKLMTRLGITSDDEVSTTE